ncbi:hypothetical protein [Sediminibacterium sp. C3]|uniref:hypothetical protein n=1 Tax=Sediminibacterium sp. C3 TaxID=1267211 RepID=UPI00041FDCDE|nr:hypothetical protein [Sediminibacterium sp. C3]
MRIFILLILIPLSFSSCKKEFNNDEISLLYKKDVLEYFSTVKHYNSILHNNKMIDSLIKNIEWNKSQEIKLDSYNKLLLIDINQDYKTINKTEKRKELKVVLQFKNQKIKSGFLVEIIGNNLNKNCSEIILDYFNDYTKVSDKQNLLISTIHIDGRFIMEFNYENGSLTKTRHLKNQLPKLEGNLKANSTFSSLENIKSTEVNCTNWFLVTTYFYSDGTTTESSRYLYTTCTGDQCQTTIDIDNESNILKSNCGGGGNETQNIQQEDFVIYFDQDRPIVDILKIFKCFENIPSNGAKFSLKLSVDIPDNSDPTVLSTFSNAGHVYLTFEKSYGNQSISQSIGFYPNNSYASLTMQYMSSVIKNDGAPNLEREEDASIIMDNMPEIDFNSAVNIAIAYANNAKYKLDDYNCTNYALDVFNFARTNNERLVVPSTSYFGITSGYSPKGVYQYLNSRKNIDSNIKIGNYKTKRSHGECN